MGKVYVRPNCSVIEISLSEAVNLGVGSPQASEDEQLSKKNFFREDPSEENSDNDEFFVNVKWCD